MSIVHVLFYPFFSYRPPNVGVTYNLAVTSHLGSTQPPLPSMKRVESFVDQVVGRALQGSLASDYLDWTNQVTNALSHFTEDASSLGFTCEVIIDEEADMKDKVMKQHLASSVKMETIHFTLSLAIDKTVTGWHVTSVLKHHHTTMQGYHLFRYNNAEITEKVKWEPDSRFGQILNEITDIEEVASLVASRWGLATQIALWDMRVLVNATESLGARKGLSSENLMALTESFDPKVVSQALGCSHKLLEMKIAQRSSWSVVKRGDTDLMNEPHLTWSSFMIICSELGVSLDFLDPENLNRMAVLLVRWSVFGTLQDPMGVFATHTFQEEGGSQACHHPPEGIWSHGKDS
ncbi:hypothetical protein M231_00882 [Tremella mesenterica]|uniref:Uncharacterized protein n=1 Tax=Tremella mesenterica TaxID=5217 RepID=A0A4Q1BUR8_TREME|nr:hypothetical protein M231_00882 [Tremella mesenterica]